MLLLLFLLSQLEPFSPDFHFFGPSFSASFFQCGANLMLGKNILTLISAPGWIFTSIKVDVTKLYSHFGRLHRSLHAGIFYSSSGWGRHLWISSTCKSLAMHTFSIQQCCVLVFIVSGAFARGFYFIAPSSALFACHV